MAKQVPQTLAYQKQLLTNRYKSARFDLLFVVLLTVINEILLLTNADYYMLFSAAIPYYLTVYAMVFCGKFPPEYYGDTYTEWVEAGFYPDTLLYAALAFAVVAVAVYLLCFIMSSKGRSGWLVFALVLFVVDTVGLLLLADLASSILDLVIHGVVIAMLSMGIAAQAKLKKLPEEEEKKGLFGF